MASVSATDLNTTDAISSDEVSDEVISVDSDEFISSIDDDLVDSEDSGCLGVTNDSEVLGNTFTLTNGGDLKSTINNAKSGDTIVLNGGTYIIWTFKIEKSLTFIGKNNPIISSEGHNGYCLFRSCSDITFKNIEFRGGSNEYGCSFYHSSGRLTVDNCSFTKGYSSKGGGAVYCFESGTCRIINSRFVNINSGGDGGAIFLEKYGEIINCIFERCSGNAGGAIKIEGPSAVIENCIFINNTANLGGSVRIYSKSPNVVIKNCYFEGSSAKKGGAIHIQEESTEVKILTSTFKSCTSSEGSAAVEVHDSNSIIIKNSKFEDCSGKYAQVGFYGKVNNVNIEGCEFYKASSKLYGGAIHSDSGNYLKIKDSCFEKCQAYTYGGAININKISEVNIIGCDFYKCFTDVNDGGAIASDSCSKINILGCNFDSCKSKGVGGSVRVVNSGNLFNIYNCSFSNSYSNNYGGSVYCYNVQNVIIDTCDFSTSSSTLAGCSIFIASTPNTIIKNSNFTNSTYNGQEAITFSESQKYEIWDSIFDVVPKYITYKYNTQLSANKLSIVKGDDGIISAKLSNVYGPLSNKQVVFNVNGKKYDRTTTSDGIATFNVKDYLTDYGPQNVIVSYEGDSLNIPVSQTVNVMINRYKAVLTLTKLGRDYYGEKTLSFKVVDYKTGEGKAEAKIHLIIYSNGEIYKTDDIYTSSNGIVTYSMAAFEPNDYTIKAYVTSENVDVNAVEDNVVISKISGKIELSTSNNNKTLNVRLVNPSNRDVYKGITVSLEFSPNGVPATVTTDANGEASFQLQDELFGVGTYTVIAKVDKSGYKEFDNAQLSNIVISTVGKDDSVVQFNNEIVFDYLKSGSTTVTLEGCTISREGCSVDDHPEASIVVSGNKITVSRLATGNYTLRVKSNPDNYHNSITRTVKITVNKIDSSLTINKEVSFNYGDTGITTVTVNGGTIVKSGVSVEGHSEAVISVVNNEIYVSNLTVGTYTLKVTTSPDSDYKEVNRTTTVTVKKINSIIDYEHPISFVYGGVGSVQLTLEGCEVVCEGCSIDNHPEAIINIDKNNVISVSNLSFGSYTLRISPIPDSNHNAYTQSIVVTVTKADSNVDLSPKSITFDYGTTGQANLILDGCSVLSDDVIVEGYSTAITRVSDGVLYVSNLPANTYTLQIKTTPDGNHESVTKKFSVTVNKPLSTVEFIGSADFDYLGVGKTTLKLTGCTVNLNDVEVVGYGDAGVSLDKSNVISISNLNSGSYTLKVKTTPDENHGANTATLAFKVNKIDSKISFTQDVISFKYAESGSTQIVLENCRVANMSVVGHDDVKPVLEDNVISVSGLPVGNYVMKVTTDPDENYNSVDAYINVAVTKNAATITVKKSQTVAYKKSTNWAITLKDSKGNAISGVKVTLKIYKGNKLYKTVTNLKATDANGITNYNTKGLPVGTYKFVVSFAHAGYTCNAVSTPVKVIKQTAVKIILNTKSDKKGAVISIIVKDKAGKKYLNNIKLTLSIKNGNKYETFTLITGNYKSGKGVCAYSTNMLTVGSHNVKVETADIKYSGSASKNVKVLASAKKYRNWWEKISKGKKTSYGT